MDKELEDVKPIVDKLFEVLTDELDENGKAITKGLVDSFEFSRITTYSYF